jgi:hypothetical protein
MTSTTNPTLQITSLNGISHSLDDLTTMFTQVWVVLPPRAEAKEFEKIINSIFKTYGDSDARCAILIPGDIRSARLVEGSIDINAQYFTDEDFKICDALGITSLPALIHIRQDTSVANIANGFDINAWNNTCKEISKALRWTTPNFGEFVGMKTTSFPVK